MEKTFNAHEQLSSTALWSLPNRKDKSHVEQRLRLLQGTTNHKHFFQFQSYHVLNLLYHASGAMRRYGHTNKDSWGLL